MKKQLFLLLSLGLVASQSLVATPASNTPSIPRAEWIGGACGASLAALGAGLIFYNSSCESFNDASLYCMTLMSVVANASVGSKLAKNWNTWNSKQKLIGGLTSLVSAGAMAACVYYNIWSAADSGVMRTVIHLGAMTLAPMVGWEAGKEAARLAALNSTTP